jgi:Short C-terminal domain
MRARLSQPATANADQAPAPPAEMTSRDDPIEQIKKLGELRDAGVLTDQEFESKKADLLSRL